MPDTKREPGKPLDSEASNKVDNAAKVGQLDTSDSESPAWKEQRKDLGNALRVARKAVAATMKAKPNAFPDGKSLRRRLAMHLLNTL